MKALSLREPWLSAVLYKCKRLENRGWNTRFRGEFALHAAIGMTAREYDAAAAFMREIGVEPPTRSELRFGGVAGVGVLEGVLPPRLLSSMHGDDPDEHESALLAARPDKGQLLRWRMDGQHGFVLADDVRALHRVIPCRGALGFFELPADVERQVREALVHSDVKPETAT